MKKSLVIVVALLAVDSCVDRIDFDLPTTPLGDLVVDGLITDEPGPYTVKLSRVVGIDETKPLGVPISAKKITLFDDAGNSEVLKENAPGVFQTDPNGTRGIVGRSYHIRVETLDNKTFESAPDRLNPVGAIDSLYFNFETRQPEDSPTEYGYRIFVNAHSGEGSDQNYLRWKFSGTFVVETKPQYHICNPPVFPNCAPPYCPLPCSAYAYVDGVLHEGYAYNPVTKQYEYVIGLSCTCCRCWVTEPENKVTVADRQLVTNGKFIGVEVGYVGVNFYTFFEKYRVEVTQMSLSPDAFRYWKAVRAQMDAAGSLFQPITGRVPTNLSEKDNAAGVQGIFYAAAVNRKYLYLDQSTRRVEIYVPQDCAFPTREGAMGESCLTAFPGMTATPQQPADWN